MIVLVLGPCAPIEAFSFFNAQKMGKIKGVVLDPIDARVVHATITIRAEGFRRKINVDQNLGEFEAEVPIGSYELCSEAAGFNSNTLLLQVRADEIMAVTIHLLPKPGFADSFGFVYVERIEPQNASPELARRIEKRKLE